MVFLVTWFSYMDVPIINLSNYHISNQERQQLKLGLDYCLVAKYKEVQRFLAPDMEYLVDGI